MAKYEGTGQENLRADGSNNKGFGNKSGDARREAGSRHWLDATYEAVPKQITVDIPPGVQHFDDDLGRVNLWQDRTKERDG